jgi:cytoskeleton protein RodZ
MSEADAGATAMNSNAGLRPGRRLAEARAARNLSVAEVAQQLKLSASQVEALEADAYDHLPGPVFVRGFVRNYARLLDLDADELLALADLPQAPSPASAAIPLSRDIPFPEQGRTNLMPYVFGLVVVIAAVVLFEVFFAGEPEMLVSAVAPQKVTEPAVVPQVQAPAPLPVVPQSTSQPEVLAAPSVVNEPPAPASAPAVVTTSAPAAEQVKPQAGLVELHFVFENDSWVEVRDRNDRILFSQLNPARSEHRMQGRRPLSLVIGNARGVRLTHDGKPFDLLPHTRVEVARFTIE